MTALPDIPRLYTALAECLAVLLFTPGLVARFSRRATVAITLVWAVVLSDQMQQKNSNVSRQRCRHRFVIH